MNRKELAAAVAERIGKSLAMAHRTIDAAIIEIMGAVARGEEVRLSGFGVFEVTDRKARAGRNPLTGAPIEVPALRKPRFRPGSDLKAAARDSKRAA